MDTARLPKMLENNLWYRYNDEDAVLVFVHGMLADSRSCWLHIDETTQQPNCYWPELIESDARFNGIGIYLGGYHTAVNSSDFSFQQCALEVYSYLRTCDPLDHRPVMDKKKITFVCHSMGGVVARYLLCEQRDAFKDKQVGIVLIASPSYGSQLTRSLDEVIYIYNHRQGKQLKWGSEILKDLDQRFKNLKESGQIPSLSGVEFFENSFVIRSKWLPCFARTKVVTEESAARYFGYATQVGGSDHHSICKPKSKADRVHQYLLQFLNDKDLLPAQMPSVARADQTASAEGVLHGAPDDIQAGLGASFDTTTKSPTFSRPLPPKPPRCYGRDSKVNKLVERILVPCAPPIPILGLAGIGKSTITREALHDARVAERFGEHRWFVRLDDALSREALMAACAAAIGVLPEPPLQARVISRLKETLGLLILDNLESPLWVDGPSTEEALEEIAGVAGLRLVASVRGDQRPGGPVWDEPIMLDPLARQESRRLFLDIAGNQYADDPCLADILEALEDVPLAVDLVARVAERQPNLSGIWQRWTMEKAKLLERYDGSDRRASLYASLNVSIMSPRITNEAKRLLGLLGFLPSGIALSSPGEAHSDLEALLPHARRAAQDLTGVGLAFYEADRLRTLAPIREYATEEHQPAAEDRDRAASYYARKLGKKGRLYTLQLHKFPRGSSGEGVEARVAASLERCAGHHRR